MPRTAPVLYEFVELDNGDYLKISEAVLRVFDRQEWLRANRARARIKVFVDKYGIDELRRQVEEELQGEWVSERDFSIEDRLFCNDERESAPAPPLNPGSPNGDTSEYTRFLSDGLPLFGEQAGSFGLLQIPPADLAQVEVVKGVASSLYGAGAMGGVVNLVSKRPRKEVEREALVNRSTRGATDGVLWYSTPVAANWGLTLLAGGHGQQRTDVDGDGWADLAAYVRGVVRPRLFWDNHAGATFFATVRQSKSTESWNTIP